MSVIYLYMCIESRLFTMVVTFRVGAKKVPFPSVYYKYKLYSVKSSDNRTLSFYSIQSSSQLADWVLEPPHKLLIEQLQLTNNSYLKVWSSKKALQLPFPRET